MKWTEVRTALPPYNMAVLVTDGRDVDVSRRVHIRDDRWSWGYGVNCGGYECQLLMSGEPTHWAPLPAPPGASE
jgi:hypothetical protein